MSAGKGFGCVVLMALCGCVSSGSTAAPADEKSYELVYTIDLARYPDAAQASITTGNNSRRFRQLAFDVDPDRYSGFSADGELEIDGGRLTWRPPREGGSLTYKAVVSHTRGDGAFDARMTADWALFRGGDIFPPAASRVLKGSTSRARLEFVLPRGWSAVTPWQTGDSDTSFPIANPERGFDRPTGWILAGDIGVRRGRIADTRVAIAAPVGEDFRRMDVMAFLNWTLASVIEVFPTMDERLLIVGAGDPMWRGGLSGPGSLYVHADRPLISENGTSTFLHELVHVAMGAAGPEHDDWLLEGLAEYYSIKILSETGTLSRRRMALSLQDLAEWGEDVDDLFARNSSGARTARAASLLAELDQELAAATDGRGLDEVVARLIETRSPYDYASLCGAARHVLGHAAATLAPARVPGAPDLDACRD